MKVIVLAYHQLGCIGIKALIDAGFQIQAVFTHRGGSNDFSQSDSVAKLAAQSKIPVWSPEDINHPLWIERIRQMAPEMLFVFGYRQLVKPEILALPLRGCYHLHQSLLPCYRGQFPLNQALAAGEDRTGITLHVMTAMPGGGDIVAQSEFSIDDNDSVMNVYEKANIAAQELLTGILPAMKSGVILRRAQDESRASRFLGRTPTGGLIDWGRPAREIRNLIRSETSPFPGAFTFLAGRKYRIWQGSESPYKASEIVPGTILAVEPLTVGCGNNTALEIDFAQAEDGIYLTGAQLAEDAHLVSGMIFADTVCRSGRQRTKVLVLGVNGFIGSAVSERLLADGKYEVYGMDLRSNYLAGLMSHPDFHFFEGDIQINREWIEYHVRKCDVILPLVAIATPIEYTRNPLRVFELDFEENLRIVRLCHQYGKRLIFPSTSEVYAMCDDETFDEDNSRLILGPIRMQRWIYSCSKQMLDRVIWAYGTKGLNFTIFRPFNWMGPKLDSLDSARLGSSRAITQLILNLVEGNPILLIDGGAQKRCFTHVTDGIECLFKIIENADKRCDGKIINIGNPENEASIRELAEILVNLFERHPLRKKFPPFAGYKEIESGAFYGQGYQDCQHRKPSIKNAWKYCDWQPVVPLEASIGETLDFFLRQAMNSEEYLK